MGKKGENREALSHLSLNSLWKIRCLSMPCKLSVWVCVGGIYFICAGVITCLFTGGISCFGCLPGKRLYMNINECQLRLKGHWRTSVMRIAVLTLREHSSAPGAHGFSGSACSPSAWLSLSPGSSQLGGQAAYLPFRCPRSQSQLSSCKRHWSSSLGGLASDRLLA